MSRLASIFGIEQMGPFSPKGANVPALRKVSMTEVISPENERWQSVVNASRGSKFDHTQLRANAQAAGMNMPGWIQLSTPLVMPASTNG